MSFILDALKRADAERAHGRVPGLHSQAVPVGGPAPDRRQPANPYLLLLGGVVIALLCLALWNWLKPSGAAAPDAAPPLAARSTPTPIAASEPAPAPAPAPAPVPVPVPAARVAAATRPATPATPAKPAGTAPSAAAAPSSRSAPGASDRSAIKAPIAPKTPAQPAAPAERPVVAQARAPDEAPKAPPVTPSPAVSELPQDIRQALPKLVISGAIYSETAAHRMLIINGQVFHEGENPAPGLALEQIKPKTAIFNFKGQRYSMGH